MAKELRLSVTVGLDDLVNTLTDVLSESELVALIKKLLFEIRDEEVQLKFIERYIEKL